MRLDRVLRNDAWLQLLPQSHYVYKHRYSSDHSPLWLHFNSVMNSGPKSFRFLSYWMQCPGYGVLQKAWYTNPSGTHQFQFVSKLKALKFGLKDWCM